MRILTAILILFFLSTTLSAQEWEELKSNHFIVYFRQDDTFANEVLRRAEKDYERIASDLGYARASNFWTWEKRVKIYIYPDNASFLEATKQPEWSQGMADYKKKTVTTYSGSEYFLTSILSHEIAHLVFRDFVGFKGEVPLWLDEGVAQREEEVDRERIKSLIKECAQKGTLLSLSDMMGLDIRLIRDTDKIYLRSTSIDGRRGFMILDGKNLVSLFYLQAASIVGYLIERYGTESFTEFCRQLRDGKALEDALCFVYPNHLRSISELEEKWIKYLKLD
ncbi:MAG: hypothetical protein ABH914_00130 [Candidatus Omnitrophota bacterium]